MANTILNVRKLDKTYYKNNIEIQSVKKVSFSLDEGEILGIVGESGSGKSTIAKVVTLLEPATGGEVYFNNQEITRLSKRQRNHVYRNMQMVFQDTVGSFNSRMKIGASIMEMIRNLTPGIKKQEARKLTLELLSQVGLKPEYADRYPHELSGGECQRAAFARAIALDPKLLIGDEVTSALDVSAQAQIIELISKLTKERNMGMILISHDLALVSCVCDKVLVMYHGDMVEYGTTKEVIGNPQNEYTKMLLNNVLPVTKNM